MSASVNRRDLLIAGGLSVLASMRGSAQSADGWLSVSGDSNATARTYVLITGVIGGVGGYRRLQTRLAGLGAPDREFRN